MEFKKCNRCGSFHTGNGEVCPKCGTKDSLEYSTFKSYITKNGFEESLETISETTGITVKNLNRFVEQNILEDKESKYMENGLNMNIYFN